MPSLWVVFPTSIDQFIIIMTSLSKLSTFNLQHRMFVNTLDAPPNSLKDSDVNLKMNTTEEGVRVCSLIHSILGMRGACQNSRIGTRTSDNESIFIWNYTNQQQVGSCIVGAFLVHGRNTCIDGFTRLTMTRTWGKPPPSLL